MNYTGTKPTGLTYFQNDGYAVDHTGRTDPAGFVQTFHAGFALTGSHVENSVAVGRLSATGGVAASFVGDFYNRVHFTPSPLAFGAFGADVTRNLKVWNAHLVQNNLNSMPISGIGVSYTGAASPPILFDPLEEIPLEFTATREGVPSFSELITFSFDLKDPYNVLFTGERSVVIERGPNWRDPMIEEVEFKTEIVARSRSGREQRRALRQEPRRSLGYTLSTWANSRRGVEGLLTRWRRRAILTPMWPWRTSTTATAFAATDTLAVDPLPTWAVSGMNIAITHPFLSQQVNAVIDSAGAGMITIQGTFAVEIPQGATVTQMVVGRIRDGQRVDRVTADVAEVPFVYDVLPGVDPAYAPPAAATFHDGYEVFLTGPNWSEGIEERWDLPVELIDAGWGQQAFYEYQDFAQYVSRMVYLGLRYGTVQALFDLFHRMKGQRGEFWMPTHGRDIEPGYQMDESATTIRIVGTDFATDWAEQTTNTALIVWLTDGTWLIRNVVDISTTEDAFGTDSVVTVDVMWPYDIPLSDIRKISWLMRMRFATDTLRIEWLNDGKANVQFSVLTLETLA